MEVIDDVALGLAPLPQDQAHRLIGSLRAYPVLAGSRGRPPVNLHALTRTLCAVGELLIIHPEIAELDLNPLVATSENAVAVDWRIMVRR